MNRSVLTLASISTLALSLAACGGGGSGGTGVNPQPPAPGQTTSPTSKATASVKVSFIIPAPSGAHAQNPSSVRKTSSLSSRKPLYVSPDTAGFSLSLDGTLLFSNNAIAPGTVTSSVAIPGGGSASYTITQNTGTGTGNSGSGSTYTYDTVSASLNVLPGNHSIGAVLQAADGFVLSEDQETVLLNGGSNTPANFFLRGVVDSAYWCDAACDGGAGTADSNGAYTLLVFPTDHAGDAIPYQLNGSTPIEVDNGPINLVETDSNSVVSITPSGPFTNPGNSNLVSYTEAGLASIQSGYSVSIKCLKTQTTTVAMQVGGLPLNGGVSGFNYSANIDSSKDPVGGSSGNPVATPTTTVYTTANQFVGTVPVAQDFGNELTVNCDANLNLTFE